MNFSTRKCPACFAEFSVSTQDPSPLCDTCNYHEVNGLDSPIKKTVQPDPPKPKCEISGHKWVGSGVPGSDHWWCRVCDADKAPGMTGEFV